MSTVIKDKVESDPEEEARLERIKKMPDVTECFNLMDFEVPPPLPAAPKMGLCF
jgi:L-lactate dehydrogenase (cytochrome)